MFRQVQIQMSPVQLKYILLLLSLSIKMQADYAILPKRNGRSDGSLRNLAAIKFYTNYYDISIEGKKSIVYQYSFELPQEIPQDSELYDKAIMSIRRLLKQKVGYAAHKGQMIWGFLKLAVPTTIQCKFEYDSKQYSLQSIIKLTKELNLRDLDNAENRPKLLQILNVSLKNALKQCKLCELGKPGQYFERQFDGTQQLYEKGLEVLKGFRFTLTPLNAGIFLQIDVCSRVLQARNLLQIFNGKPKDENRQKFIGQTVITRYGTYRTYKILDIDYNKTPLSTFDNEKKGVATTYLDYYKDVYGLTIKNTKQPLLKVEKSLKKQFTKGGKIEKISQIVYLVPEFVSPTGMTDEQRADHNTMKALAPFTKLSPTARVQKCAQIVQNFNNVKEIIQIKQPKRFEGFCLPRPQLMYSGAKINPDNRGNIKHRGVLKQPFNFTDWIFVYSVGSKNPKRDDEDADDAVSLMKKAAQSYGVKFKEPGFIAINSNNPKQWKDEILRDTEKNGTPQIIVVYLNGFQEKYYGELKKFITNQLKCPSQFIRKRTLTNPKGAMSAASKIIIQMNIKVGAVPWEVQKKHEYLKKKNLMYGALSISKGSKGNTLAFVGTINDECTKVVSDCKVGIKDKQNIPVQMLQEIFINWAKSYYQVNKKAPSLILLYREGLSIQQTKNQLPRTEIPALENMIKKIGEKTGIKNYKPQIMIVTVNKKINSRYFAIGKENQQNPSKFVPQLFNPDSGSIVAEPLSVEDSYDFHLAAQYVTQGTCTPTLFKVAYDTSSMPQQALMSFTFEQCFNYYNWEGAVKVPACLQCADKLSKLVGQYIKEDIVQSAVTKKHFFL